MFRVAVRALAVKCCLTRLWLRRRTRRQDRLFPRTTALPSKSPHQWHSSLPLCKAGWRQSPLRWAHGLLQKIKCDH
ncbi:hypothetical protein JG687_00017184 [Phytophthora cactorum]|uniref:Uncharacterized protein n=1 Tax=Phytophthora cactorum TaxID=29920 RepID=A0A8T1TSM6_9STRA|nr:hypothetical protein JG687_00017184 [Phytophthora cactorum]